MELKKKCMVYLTSGTKYEVTNVSEDTNAYAEINDKNELIVSVYAETFNGARWFKYNYGTISHIEYKED